MTAGARFKGGVPTFAVLTNVLPHSENQKGFQSYQLLVQFDESSVALFPLNGKDAGHTNHK